METDERIIVRFTPCPDPGLLSIQADTIRDLPIRAHSNVSDCFHNRFFRGVCNDRSVTYFTNGLDPKPRSRKVFSFPRPETSTEWLSQSDQLRARLKCLPALDPAGLWKVQAQAIGNLEESFADADPRALIQMATGSGKTFAAVYIAYRLLKFSRAKRILFLVDRGNLGKQTEDEFANFTPPRRIAR